MSIAALSLRYGRVVWFFLAMLLLGGAIGFVNLGKKEDAVFVIKSASLTCNYAGATPLQVEQLITEPIEREVQTMSAVHKITSESSYGTSRILVELHPGTSPDDIPLLWDELRRKVLNVQSRLPSGASEIIVADDYGDVYGLYCALTADDGFSWDELRDEAQRLKTEMYGVEGVRKVTLYGEQQPVVNLYVSLSMLANFSIRPEAIISTIGSRNRIVDSGEKQTGEMTLRIIEDGLYGSISDIEDQLLISSDGKQFRLGDVARVERSYAEPPTALMRVDGMRAIGIGVSTESKSDVVKVGHRINALIERFTAQLPLGMEVVELYPEDKIAAEANRHFAMNLAESVVIVVLILMAVMGWRSGLLIGSSLLFTIGGTLLIMNFLGEGLNRTSLAGFIIAMGMLVDNSIVVTDNALRLMRRGTPRADSLIRGAEEPKMALLGATLIAILSFLPLYLAPSSVAEIVKPLFVVITISLLLSWLLSLSETLLLGEVILRKDNHSPKGDYFGWFDVVLRQLLSHRYLTVGVVIVLFAGSLWAMSRMPQNFFPSLDKPYFRADVWLPEGYNIRTTESTLRKMESWLREQPSVKRVSLTAGSTPPRYYLASGSVALRPNFGNLLVELHSTSDTEPVEQAFAEWVEATFPDVWLRSSLFKLSPVPDAAIEIGFIGRDADTLLRLASEAEAIMRRDVRATNVRNSWGNRIPAWIPVYSQMRGQRIGISRSELAQGLTVATSGYPLGEYREGDRIMPILLRDENIADYNLTNLEVLPLFNPSGRVYALEQAIDSAKFDFRRGVIKRYNRMRVVKAQCDPARGENTSRLLSSLVDSVTEQVTLPEGYSMRLFGEQESRQESNEALAKNLPLAFVLIFIILLLLFGDYRSPIAVLLMTPLIFIGVVAGLLLLGKEFDFFSLLGLLGLVGMNVKNGVVLVESIRDELSAGGSRSDALIRATHSRIIPVTMASLTTIVGMSPLLFDSLFGGMAATIMGGLFVAALLTLFVLPVVYALFYNIKVERL